MKKKERFYTVWKGFEPGVYATWQECEARVKGYTGAVYKSFRSREEAEIAFQANPQDYIGKDIRPMPFPLMKTADGGPVGNSISVDAACSGNPGAMEYRGVYTETGTEIFRQVPFPLATNNIGEFLALVHALAWMKKNKLELPVYSDSRNAIGWVKKKQVNTKLIHNKESEKIYELLQRALHWLNTNEYNVSILKWNTRHWGEIPADFGRKS